MFTTIVLETPHWVWGVLAALIFMGFKQTVPRRRSLRSATALPLVMVVLSLYGVASAFSSQPLALRSDRRRGTVCLKPMTIRAASTPQTQ
jgi:hypothetical protein